MKIQAYTQVQQLDSPKKSNRTSSTTTVSGRRDALELSSIGKDIQTAKKAVSESADIRESITAPIKAQIQNGTYEVSGDSFAAKLIAKYNEQA